MSKRNSYPNVCSDDPRSTAWANGFLNNDEDDIAFEETDEESENVVDIEEVIEVSSDSDYGIHEDLDWNDSDSDQAESFDRDDVYYGRNKFKWFKEPSMNVGNTACKIVVPGLCPKARELGNNPKIEDVWALIFSQDMIAEIVHSTNIKITETRKRYKNENVPIVSLVDVIEMRAFLGILVYTSVFKAGNENIDSLFATDGTGRDVFRCTMPKQRFQFLLTVLRFDEATTRKDRQNQGDPIPQISKIFNKLIENSQTAFFPGTNVTVDKMLIAFRGSCRFKVYMAKQPARYGIKVMCLTDANNGYLFNAYVYSGKGSDSHYLSSTEKKLKIPTQAVLRLCNSIANSNRNVTADNWFSSVQVVQELQSRGLTYVGTLQKNQAEIPKSFHTSKNRVEKSSIYGFNKEMTLLSYVPKPSKSIILISSLHHNSSSNISGRPEMIEFYNSSKAGVDILVKNCTNYCCSRRTRRWPMTIFFTLLDVSTMNAYVLYSQYSDTPKIERGEFLKSLARNLVLPQWERRLTNSNIPKELRMTISRLHGNIENIVVGFDLHNDRLENRSTCRRCAPKLKRKTQYLCTSCKTPICLQCSKKICVECVTDRLAIE